MTEFNPYLARLQSEQAAALHLSMAAAVGKQPDHEAELQQLSSGLNQPEDAVRQNVAAARQQAALQAIDYEDLVKRSPVTSRFLSNANFAALAHDDVPQLTGLEQALRFGRNTGRALLSGVFGFGEGVAGQAQAGAELLSQYVTAPLAGSVLPVDVTAPVADAMQRIRQSQRDWREYLTPTAAGPVAAGYYSGLQSLSQNMLTWPLALVSNNPELALRSMALNTGGQSYGKARDAGLAPPQASVYAGADAAIEYATERMPLQSLFKDVKVGTPFFSMLSKQLAQEIPGEQAATLLQDLNEWAVLHPEQSVQDYLDARPDAALQTLVATAVASSGQGSLLHGMQAISQRKHTEYQASIQLGQQLRAVADWAAASRLRSRDPQALHAFVDAALQDGPVQQLYIDPEVLRQSGAEKWLQRTQPDISRQMSMAFESGAEIGLPLSDFVSRLAGHELLQPIIDEWRLEGAPYSLAEAQRQAARHGPEVLAEVQRELSYQQLLDSMRSNQGLQQRLHGLISQVSPFSSVVNDSYAALLTQFYAVQADKFGISAEDLYRQYPLQISGESAGRQWRFGQGVPKQYAMLQQFGLLLFPHREKEALLQHLQKVAEKPEHIHNWLALQEKFPPGNKYLPTINWLADLADQGVSALPLGTTALLDKALRAAKLGGWPKDEQQQRWLLTALAAGIRGKTVAAQPPSPPVSSSTSAAIEAVVPKVAAEQPTSQDKSTTEDWSMAALLDKKPDTSDRGSFNPFSRTISLHKRADLSTLLHEAAHFFLEVQMDLSTRVWNQARVENQPLQEHYLEPNSGLSNSMILDDVTGSDLQRNDVPVADYAARAGLVQQEMRTLGATHVRSPRQAAQALGFLHRWGKDRFDALLTDDTGKPLAVVGAQVGPGSKQAQWRKQLAAEAFRVKGATRVWFAHNRPTKDHWFKTSDRRANQQLSELFRDSSIKPMGFIVIAKGVKEGFAWSYAPAPLSDAEALEGKKQLRNQDKHGYINDLGPVIQVPVLQLVLQRDGALVDHPISLRRDSPIALELANGRSGMLLLDNAQAPRGYLPLLSHELMELRTQGRMEALYRAISMVDAQEAILINYGDLSDAALENLLGFLHQAQLPVRDVFKVKQGRLYGPALKPEAYRNTQGFKQSSPDTEFNQHNPQAQPDVAVPSPTLTQPGHQQLLDDGLALLNWFGVDGLANWQNLDFEQRRQFHEQFARGFEAYLFEGKAPSLALQGLFERFRAWLRRIYRNLRDFYVDLTPEVRGVFDRMLAAEQELRWAEQARGMQALLTSAQQVEVTAAEFAHYVTLQQRSRQAAEMALQAIALKDLQWAEPTHNRALKRLQAIQRRLRAQVKAAVTHEVMHRPVYQAQTQLMDKKSDVKLAVEDLQQRGFKPNEISRLQQLGMTADLSKWDADAVAEWYDFASGDELIRALLAAARPEHEINRLTTQVLLQNFGELGSIEELKRAVSRVMHNALRGELLAMEADMLARFVGGVRLQADAIAEHTRKFVQQIAIADLRSQPYLRAEARVAVAAEAAVAQGEFTQAAEFKRRQLVCFYAAQAAFQAEGMVSDGLRYLQGFYMAQSTLPTEQVMMIWSLLNRFGLGGESTRQNGYQESLSLWLQQPAQLDWLPEWPQQLVNGPAKRFVELSVTEFNVLLNFVKQIEHVLTLQQQGAMLLPGQTLKMAAVERDLIKHMRSKQAIVDAAAFQGRPELPNLAFLPDGAYDAAVWAFRLDGANLRGPAMHYFIKPAVAAASATTLGRMEMQMALKAILQPLLTQADQALHIASLKRTFSREQRLMIALNCGNRSNLQYLLRGESWREHQLQDLLDTITLQEWQAIQAIWDLFGGFKQQIADRQQRIYGVAADFIELSPRIVYLSDTAGERQELFLPGGYFPLSFNARFLADVEDRDMSRITRLTYLQAYSGNPKHFWPLSYRFSALFSGVDAIVYDLNWFETWIDMRRLLRSESLRQAMTDRYKLMLWDMDRFVEQIHVGGAAANRVMSTAAAQSQAQRYALGMGYAALEAGFAQVGYFQAVAELGPFWLAKGVKAFLFDPRRLSTDVNNRSELVMLRSLDHIDKVMALQEHQIEVMPTMASGVASLLLLHAQLFSELVIWWAAYQRALGRGLTDEQSWDEADGIMQRILPFDREIKPNEELERLMHAYFYFMRTGFALGKDREIVPEYRGKLTAEYLLQHPLPLVLGREVLNGVGEAATGDWPQFMEQALNLRLGEHLPWLATEREFVETGLVKGPAFDMMSKMDFNALGIKGFADFKELELSTQAYLLMLIDLMFDNNAWRHAGDLVSWGRR